jgi:VWFA-related protein
MRSVRVTFRVPAWLLTTAVLLAAVGRTPLAQQDVIRTGVTMVPIDVRAFDRQGKPVTNLTADELSIFEDGVPQQLAYFSTRAFTPDGPVAREVPTRVALRPTDGTASPLRAIAPQTSRVYLIVLGRGRLQLPNQGIDGVLHFVRHRVLPQDRVAIVAYNRATDFTTDHASLLPILERYKKAHEDIEVKLVMHFSGLAGVYRKPGIPAFIQADIDSIFSVPGMAQARTMPSEDDATAGGRDQRRDADYRRRVADALVGDPSAGTSDSLQAAAEGMTFDEFVASSVKEALDAANIHAGINYLRSVEGEKHLIYLAYGGFKTSGFMDTLENLARTASHARVALDIVHTGGIQFGGRAAEAQTIAGKLGLDNDPFRSYLYGGTTISSTQTAQMLARETGGAFNANRYRMAADDLTAMDLATRFQYTLGYYPSRSDTDGRYRKIEVRSTRPGVMLQFRGGYYARPPLPAPLGQRELLSYTRISRAFEYAPPIEDIKVRGSLTLTGEKNARAVRVDVTIDMSRIVLRSTNERHAGSVEVAVFTVDGRQRQIQDLWQRIELDLTDSTHESFRASGIPHSATLPAPPDLKAVKVVVYDYAADLVGSLILNVR